MQEMQTLIKLALENGLQQGSTRSPKLSFACPEQNRTNQVVDQKITLTRTLPYLSCHSLKQRDSSISLNRLAIMPLHNYLTPSWGFLAISLSWAVES